MYNLFYYNIDKMSDALFTSELALLPRLRRQEILKKAKLSDQKRSLTGDMLAKKYLSKLYGVAPETLVFARGEHGKPYVLNLPAHFNISHSGKYTVLAVSDQPIGVDIEMIRDFSAIFARKRFQEQELQYLAGEQPARRKSEMQRCFYEIWTGKEAYAKYTGKGLAGGLNALTFSVKNGKLIPNNTGIQLTFDYDIPGAVTAIVTNR